MNAKADGLPAWLLDTLTQLPQDTPVALLLRHAQREALPEHDTGHMTPITPTGARLAQALGAHLGPRLQALHSSPVLRCRQTAEQIRSGAGQPAIPISCHRFLGDPGIYVENPEHAWQHWQTLGNQGVMTHLANASHALPGMAHPETASLALLDYLLASASHGHGLHLFISHDVLLSACTARLLGVPYPASPWPDYLEGMFCWTNTEGRQLRYRHYQVVIPAVPLMPPPDCRSTS